MQRILYVDDDEILVRLVRRVLRRAGYEVEHADGAEAALARIAGDPFDAVVLDHYLRDGTGHDILRRMRSMGCTAPVVYVTASAEASVAVEALKSGAADYVMKTTGEEFLALLERSIRQSIETARLRREREEADAETRAAKDRAEALLAEVNHRVANSLALVTSLLRLQATTSTNEEAKAILTETCGRIAAIVNVHRSLYTDEDVEHVQLDRYLRSLAADLALTLPAGVRLDLAAEPVTVRSDRAVAVGIIVTELVANAAKYAYPGGGGAVRIRLERLDPATARLFVEDDGVGTDAGAAPKGTGLGQRIVRSMAASLGSDLAVLGTGAGTRAEVRFEIGADRPRAAVA